MSTIKDITDLRHKGLLREAYRLAKKTMNEEQSPWSFTAMFWVLRDIVLKCIATDTARAVGMAHNCLAAMEEISPHMKDDSGAGKATIAKLKRKLEPHYDEIKQCADLSKTTPTEAYEKAVATVGTQAESLNPTLHEEFGWILYRYLKAKAASLTSLEVRKLLRDYICLKNERPSMLHSMMLNFSLNFSKNHADFKFPNFFKLWGLSNLREEDLKDGTKNGTTIPSLISRVCASLAMTDTPMVKEIAEATKLPELSIVDMCRKQWMWHLYDCHKENRTDDFWRGMATYAERFGNYKSSKWHSSILGLALRSYDAAHAKTFLDLMLKGSEIAFSDNDFKPEMGKKGGEFPPLAVQLAKKCSEAIKAAPQYRHDISCIESLLHVYEQIEKNGAADEWTKRQHALRLIDIGNKESAATIYKNLLKSMPDKFYLWQEMAQCTDDEELRAGLLVHALELEKTEDLIGPLRLQTASALLDLGYAAEAGKYAAAYAKHRKKQGKPLPSEWAIIERRIKEAGDQAHTTFDKQQAVDEAFNYIYSDCPWCDFVLANRYTFNDKPRVMFTDGNRSFSISPKRFGIKQELGTVFKVRCQVNGDDVTPLTLQATDQQKWGSLEKSFGCIVHVNSENSSVTVAAQGLGRTYFFDKKKRFKKGDFISFRHFTHRQKNKTRTEAASPQICDKEEALSHFDHATMVVDDVNDKKLLFHLISRENEQGCVVKFDETELRPSVGDIFEVATCAHIDKKGKKRIDAIDLKASSDTSSELVKTVEGILQVKSTAKQQAAFGFVKNVYVPRSLLLQEGFSDNTPVLARAVYTGDGKWKAFELESDEREITELEKSE